MRRSFHTLVLGLLAAACGSVSQEDSECLPSELLCSEQCVSPLNDLSNCGTCGNACAAGEVCGDGACQAECPAELTECGETCFDTSSDIDNCGGCGISCDAGNEECRDGQCVVPCDRGLNAAVQDPLGFSWDGNERALTDQSDAAQTCTSFGARLPTATELFRISANETGLIGQTSDTNPLWTSARNSPTRGLRMRLSDGSTDDDLRANDNYYRCVCEPARPIAFTGAACYGDIGSECQPLGVLGQRYNMDSWDRPALTKREALEDCQRSGAQLADFRHYVAVIATGSLGSGVFLHVADDARDDLSVMLRWDGDQRDTWASSGNITAQGRGTRHPYRCVGANFITGTHPSNVPNQFVGRTNGLKGETTDSTATSWAEAHDTCNARGGHLPTSAEMAELIMHGLPSGSSLPLWTADQAGYDGGTFRATMVSWTGVEQDWFYRLGTEVSWRRQSETHPFRCVYYPLDLQYSGPAAGECSGGCAAVALPGGATAWLDSTDRTAMRPERAHFECLETGGFLASERDITEAVRAGLPNGTGSELWVSDYANLQQKTVRWSDIDVEFTDLFPTYQTWSGFSNDRPFRCMWTNEIR